MTLSARSTSPNVSTPAFIVGSHRSGTTLLRYLVDSHPKIACPPESKFLCALAEMADYPQTLRALNSMGVNRRALLNRLRILADSFFVEYAIGKNKVRWIDKTPNYSRILPFIDELYSSDALYIIMVRHPLDTIDSLNSYFGSATTHHDDPDIAGMLKQYGHGKYGCALFWKDTYQRIKTFAASCSNRVCVVRYEDLVGEPLAELTKIFAFLGEDTPLNFMDTAFHHVHDQGYGDRYIRMADGIFSSSIGRWRTWPSEEIAAVWESVRGQAEDFGYGVD